ncbi:hypothetical protein BEP19_02545 [Ammoniphilus oxalaticus]|uniref:SbsA Ig-like domain-containing protein n=1 Tax=Ammoniphilus oxalaticus TaxID=66863 RepID=A0A419SNK0_9BACL|nr:Ig-like domain-containing protein [Ammoniphilus oxalaticus]RKD25833.1 hypothetical protein BEP19_02545 [Ammoniphilus oxalaticus]
MEKMFLFWMTAFSLLVVLVSSVDAKGDGTGGRPGKGIAFALETSSIKNGEKQVPLDQEIKLSFSHNVVHPGITQQNKAAISLLDHAGEDVDIEIHLTDDQIDSEKQREITIKPTDPLTKGTTYRLQIEPTFQAENGMTLDEPIELAFTTESVPKQTVQAGFIVIGLCAVGALVSIVARQKKITDT